MRHDKTWYICEDSDTFFIGNSADLFDYLEHRAVLPYIVFYQTCEDEPDETPKFDKAVHDTDKRDEVIKNEKRKVSLKEVIIEYSEESKHKDRSIESTVLNQTLHQGGVHKSLKYIDNKGRSKRDLNSTRNLILKILNIVFKLIKNIS